MSDPTASPPLHSNSASAFRSINNVVPVAASPRPHSSTSSSRHSPIIVQPNNNKSNSNQVLNTLQSPAGVPLLKRANTTVAPSSSPPQSERNSPIPSSAALNSLNSSNTAPLASSPHQQQQQQHAAIPAHSQTYQLPLLTPPPQFMQIEPCLYRCGRFHELHHSFLTTLQLRSLVYLSSPTKYPITSSMKSYCFENGIDIHNVGASVFTEAALLEEEEARDRDGSSSSSEFMTSSVMLSAYTDLIKQTLDHVLLAPHSPCLIVCHNGLDLSSLIVGCLRKLQGWCYTSTLEEFTRSQSSQLLHDEFLSTQSNNIRKDTTSSSFLRYTLSNAERWTDTNRIYHQEELIEIFDLDLVTIPELHLDSHRNNGGNTTSSRRRRTNASVLPPPLESESRQQQQPHRDDSRSRANSMPTGDRPILTHSTSQVNAANSTVSSTAATSLCVEWFRQWKHQERCEKKQLAKERKRRRRKKNDNTTSDTQSQQQTSITIASDPRMIFTSSQLISEKVKYDKKMSLVEDDED